jgi:NADPH:quinone reductase-like Zn-dependent oxidoreductase
MKTYYLDQPGSLDNLAMRETPTPTPGPREVLMRVHATSLNYRDLGLALGTYKSPSMPLPLVPMSDGAGEIVAVGNGVTRVKVGDRVAGIFHQGWIGGPRRPEHPVGDLGGGIHGMLSEYVVLSEDGVVVIPEQLSFEEAATLPCAAVTAWNTLQVQRPLQAGETVGRRVAVRPAVCQAGRRPRHRHVVFRRAPRTHARPGSRRTGELHHPPGLGR